MAEPISIQQLKDASLDVKSLEEVVNGDENVVVTTRLGETYPSVKGSIKKVFETGGLPATPFATKALMTASALVDGKYAMVTDDVANNGLYAKTSGTWVKSSYDPIGMLNAYKDEASYLVADSDDFSIVGFVTDGGSFPVQESYRRTDYLPVLPDTAYVIDSKTVLYAKHAWFDKNKVFISVFGLDQTAPLAVTAPANAAYLIASKQKSNTTASVKYKNVGYNISKIRDIIKTTKIEVSSDDVKNNGQTLTQTLTQYPAALAVYQASQATAKGHENRNNYVSVAPAIANTYAASMPENLKSGLRGEVVYEPNSKMLHIPAQMMIMSGTTSYLTTATSLDLTTNLATTSLLRIYYDTTDKVFVPLNAATVITAEERAKYLLFATLRHGGSIINLIGNFNYRIGAGVQGDVTYNDRPSIIPSNRNLNNTLNCVNFDSKNGTMTIPADTIIRYKGYQKIITADIVINLRAAASSAKRVYWDLISNEFVALSFIPNLSVEKQFTHVLIASIRDYSTASAINTIRIEVDYTGYYTIDNKPFGITNAITPMLLDDTVKGIAHRGYSTVAPENTLIAYTLAKRAGFTYIECDVSITKDDIPVLSHDDTIDARSNGTGLIADMTLAELRQYDYGSWKHERYTGTPIPTFEEFIKHCHKLGLHPYIELKGITKMTEPTVQNIIDIVRAAGMRGKVTYISGYGQLQWVKAYDPDARLGLVSNLSNAAVDQVVTLRTATNEVFADVGAGNLLDGTALASLAYAKSLGVAVEVWTVNRVDHTLQLAALGIQGIATDILNIRQILNDDAGV